MRGLSVYRARVSRGTRSGARSRACVCALGSCVVAGSRCWRLGEARARACEWLNRQCAGWSRHDAWARSDCGGVGGFEQGVVGASEARQQGDQEHVRRPQRVQEVVDRVEVKVLDLCSDLTNWRHGQEKVVLGGEEQRGVDGRGGGDVHGDVQRGHVERVRRLLDGVVVEHVAEVHVLRQHVVCDGQEELGRAVGRAGGARIRASGQPNVSAPRAAQAPASARRRRRWSRQSTCEAT